MKNLLSLLIALLLTPSLHAQQDETVTAAIGGYVRTFVIHVPSDPPPADLPVLFCFHGTGGSSTQIRAATGFNALADQHNFIVVYPQALKIGNDVQWNVYVDDKPGHGGVGIVDAPDDVEFTRGIINALASRFNIDTKRVFATGHSNGGFISYALSMLASDAIAAIAPVSANMWAEDIYLNQLIASGTVKPMPVMHVHGTEDKVVAYPDIDNTPKNYEEYPLFVAARTCGAVTYSQVEPIMAGVDKLVFCPPPVEVSLIRVQGMGHVWSNGAYPTSSEIVKFFGLTATTSGVDDQSTSNEFRIAPNPASVFVRLLLPHDATVQMVSSLGTVVYSARHDAGSVNIPCSKLPSGMYSVRVIPVRGEQMMTRSVVVVH